MSTDLASADTSTLTAANAPIRALVDDLVTKPQIAMPLTHHFAPGIYTREIFMPAGTFVIGHEHRTTHFNIVLTGRARVMMEADAPAEEIVAPCIFVSGAGVQKVLLIEEDMRWLTIHTNPDDETDIATLEERLLNLSAAFLEAKGNRTVDEMRMSPQPPTTKEITV